LDYHNPSVSTGWEGPKREDQRAQHLEGRVKEVERGAVNSEVTIELPGGQELVSVISRESATDLGLAPGRDVYAVIKASNVMIGVDH